MDYSPRLYGATALLQAEIRTARDSRGLEDLLELLCWEQVQKVETSLEMNVAVIVRGMFKRLFKEIAFEKDPSWIGLHMTFDGFYV